MCYVVNPHNFNEIAQYVVVEKHIIKSEIINAKKCYFYDACSFRKHAHLKHPEYIFDFIKKFDGVIVITRCILMELASHSGILNSEYIEYIKNMYDTGLKALILYEEDLFDVLSLCFASNATINNYLSWAVKTVKSQISTIESTLKTNRTLLEDVIKKKDVADSTLFTRFFNEVRDNKESGDNLGEELIAMCVHLLANIPEGFNYKYVVMTDDKGAIGLINKVDKNVFEHEEIHAFSALTTTRLAQRLFEEKIICKKDQLEEVLFTVSLDNMLKILGSEEYDLKPEEKTFTYNELAEKIMVNTIHINY